MSDHWTHHDPAVRELIRAAQEKAWDEGFRFESTYLDTWGQFCPAALARNPYRATTTVSGPVSETGPAHTTGGQP